MVLKNNGFTLIELIVAMSIAAIVGVLALTFHRDFGKALRAGWQRLQGRQAEMVWVSSLERGLIEGRGLTEVSPRTLFFLSRAGRMLKVEKTASDSIRWNGKAMPFPVAELAIAALGPDCPDASLEKDPDCRILLDSLDGDGDGTVELDELDRDRDGLVSGQECRMVRLVELRWRSAPGGQWRSLTLHPRIRVTDPDQDGNLEGNL